MVAAQNMAKKFVVNIKFGYVAFFHMEGHPEKTCTY